MQTINSESTRMIKGAFFAVVIFLSAMTTAIFFYDNFTLSAQWPGWLNGIIGGAMGLAVLDLGALAWLKIYLGGCDNNTERTIAVFGFSLDMVGSAITTFVQLMLSTALIEIPPNIGSYSVVFIAVVVVANFVMVAMMTKVSTTAKMQEQQAAMVASGLQEAFKLAKIQFDNSIPQLATAKAQQLHKMAQAEFLQHTPIEAQQPQPIQQSQIMAATSPPAAVYLVPKKETGYSRDTEVDFDAALMANEAAEIDRIFGDDKKPANPTQPHRGR